LGIFPIVALAHALALGVTAAVMLLGQQNVRCGGTSRRSKQGQGCAGRRSSRP